MRRREETDPAVARRFAAVWPAVRPADPSRLAGPEWPETPGRREAEAAWRALDEHDPVSGPSAPAPPPPGPPFPPPSPPGPPPGRWALGGFDPGRRGVRVLAVVAALVVLVAAYLAWRSRPHAEPVAPVGSAAPPPAASVAPTATIVVAVQGRVVHPGLYRLPAGSRVADALAAAGGALPGVDLSFVNLARRLVDGELLLVGATPPPDQAGPGATPAAKVDLNTATLTQLDTLPGVGPALAQRIVDYRTAHGGFRSVDELRHVEGIGDAKFAQLKDLVTV